ncbi:SGNH/GDSL hydrolase family protein [Planomicrobium sp. CPCC 101079]|uniref:SGNH/GDSL hydrolase family protein n=1 Tax=Planomicrobium sp. CPCC 101079 TaxID=2599618 RepID=UPI0011B4A206|nr:SGNH/GDSL hydrolase family protein [Planomicrobium sp. CPCC 101079]TWT03589.1 SGNH/GDSL hydrolase family protein [Planomicrobium sp. CPCC 101079]
MRKLIAILLVIGCIVLLGFSYITWKDKLAAASTKPAEAATLIEEKEEKAETSEPIKQVVTEDQLERLMAELDESVQKVFTDRFEADEKVQLLIVGSEAMDAGDVGYGEELERAIEEAYGGFIEVDAVSFDGTSAEFIEEEIDLSSDYDVVLFEPFTLNNNGLVEIEVEHEHIEAFYGQLQTEVSDAVLLLQPPQPIYGAGYYLTQVNALEEFASLSDIVYINHWSAWPATTDPALQDYLTEEKNPNDTGSQTWANELKGYFIAE